MAEERTNLQNVTAERDEFAQETRDRETRILILNNEMEGMRKTNEDLQRVKKQLEMELDEIMQNKDDVGKNTFELGFIFLQIYFKSKNNRFRESEETIGTGIIG